MGDIIEDFHEVIPHYDKNNEFSIKISNIEMFVILTPCCSIEHKEAIIVPLKKINEKLIVSEFLRDNLLLVNMPINKKISMGEQAYNKTLEKMPLEEQILFRNINVSYEFCDYFVFDGNDKFKEYSLERKRGKDDIISITTRCHMISFKDAMRVNSSIFERNGTCNKILELTPVTRKTLRDKLVFFYSRVPDEDKIYLP